MIEVELGNALSSLRSDDGLPGAQSMEGERRRVFAALVCLEEVAGMKTIALLDSSAPLALLKCALYFLDNAGHFGGSPAREHISVLCDLITPIDNR